LTAVLAGSFALAWLQVNIEEAEAERQRKHDKWVREEKWKGRTVAQLADGNFISYSKPEK